MANDIAVSTLAGILYGLTRPEPVTARHTQPYQWATIEPGGESAPAAPATVGPHWVGPVVQALLDRALAVSRSADPAGSTAGLVVSKLDLDRFVDDLCRAPATWPVPVPLPGTTRWWPDYCLPDGGLLATDLLVAAAHLHRAADQDGAHPARADLVAAADRLFDTGLSGLAEQAKIQAKHQSATAGLHPTRIILAKHQ